MMVSKYLMVSVLCLFSLCLNAQNELEFNKVINEKITGTGGGALTTKSVTVPAGKVWKITAASAGRIINSKGTVPGGATELAFTLSDVSLYYQSGSVGRSNYNQPFPFWLPAGTYTMKLFFDSSTAFSLVGTISAIEFNVKK